MSSQQLDAVVGFVDLAGFTTAAERLGQAGPRGTERLRDLINELFTPVIDIVHDAGGEIGWFAGDAVGVLFDTAVTSPAQAVQALAQSAAAIEAMPPLQTPIGPVTLGVKVGIAAGSVAWQAVGDEHIVSWFGGAAVDWSSDAEGHCEAGDIVLHESVLHESVLHESAAGLEGFELAEIAAGFVQLTAADGPVEVGRTPVGEQSPLADRRSLAYQPPRVARLAQADRSQFLDEHRPVTMIFQRLAEPTHEVGQLAELRAAVEQLGGLVQLATEGDKGALVLALFGAPTALADREARAVLGASRMRDIVPGSQVGVASGRVYAGRVGSAARWDYSVIGDRVNTAARLMQAADLGEVLVDEATASGAGATVAFDGGRDVVLKGKAEPELAFAVERVRGRGSPSLHLSGRGTAFVGRTAEIETLLDRLESTGVTVVVGRAGSGKSRLLGRVAELATREPDVVVLYQTDRGRPFALWQQLLPRLLPGIEDASAELVADERFPLLGPLLGQAVPDSPLTASIGREDRLELLASFLVELLADAEPGPAVVIEDLHWADDGSLQLLTRVSAGLAGAGRAVVASARPDPPVAGVRAAASVDEVQLEPIGPGEMAELIQHLWRASFGQAAAISLVDELVERAGGSPLFGEQLVAFAVANGVEPAAEALPADIGVPEDLTDLLLARLDALPADAATVATLGAVLRESFSPETLLGAFGSRYEPDVIAGGIEELRDRGVIAGFGEYDFVHSLFAETTHDRLSYALLAALHLDVVQYLEAKLGHDIEREAVNVARHAEHTDDNDRKRRYFHLAGDQAAEQYAGEVAAYWYTRLVPLLDGAERGQVLLDHAEIESVSGDIHIAEQNLISAIKDLDDAAPAELALARVLVKQGSTGAAFDLLDDLIERTESSEAWGHLHAALDMKADVSTMLGDIERAEQVESHHAELVAEHGPAHEVSAELKQLTNLAWLREDFETVRRKYTRYYEKCIEERRLVQAAIYAADLAGACVELDDTDGAYEWLETALKLTELTGDVRERSVILGNESGLRLESGDHEGAFTAAAGALTYAVEAADPRGMLGSLRAVASLPGRHDAESLLRRALVLAETLGEQSFTDVLLNDYRSIVLRSKENRGSSVPVEEAAIDRLLRAIDARAELADWEHRSNRLLAQVASE